MTRENFYDFIAKNKVVSIERKEVDGHILHFDNGEYIDVSSGGDEIVYTHSGTIRKSNVNLFEELQILDALRHKQFLEKYGKQ